MNDCNSYVNVGIDLGSLYLKLIVTDEQNNIQKTVYCAHKGNPLEVLHEEILKANINGNARVAVIGKNASLLEQAESIYIFDEIKSLVVYIRKNYPYTRNIIDVGGGSCTLVRLDKDGNILNFETNSMCAAGTGAFLDEQAVRLGIDYEEISTFTYNGEPPSIAARCSVFARSDLIHRQQEGYGKDAMWSGLCKSMTNTMVQTLLRGKPLEGPTIITGGIAKNKEVLRWLNARFNNSIEVFEHSHLAGALGVTYKLNGNITKQHDMVHATSLNFEHHKRKIFDHGEFEKIVKTLNKGTGTPSRKPLTLIKSRYPSFDIDRCLNDEDCNEIRIINRPGSAIVPCYIGLDIGSTSTKMVVMDVQGDVVLDIYRKTLGAPIRASQYLFKALEDISGDMNVRFDVRGFGTTGSGRKLIGKIVGADAIINEITCFAKGATHVDGSIETIFEIGGQDSKFISLKSGRVHDSNMNYVCAAGTGSFVEEIAKKMGMDVNEIGDLVMGVSPPVTSDRCTVFMEQDVLKLIRQGYDKRECMAAVLYSVARNYLTKVVGNRKFSNKRIFYFGATARNRGLVAAFENLLGAEIVVSPYCHVMGAYGAALLARENIEGLKSGTRFNGIQVHNKEIGLAYEKCGLCANNCTVTHAVIDGVKQEASWGYMCGREPEEKKVRKNKEYSLFRSREALFASYEKRTILNARGTIGIPLTMTLHSYLPLMHSFFNELGYNVIYSGYTDNDIKSSGNEIVGAEFCYPVKSAHGHVQKLASMREIHHIVLPVIISNRKSDAVDNSMFCPYVQGGPSVCHASLQLNKIEHQTILKPVIDFRMSLEKQVGYLARGLAALSLTKKEIQRAWIKSCEEQDNIEKALIKMGADAIIKLKEENRKGIVLIGRPYNLYDSGLNISLPEKISEYGFTVIPADMIPFDVEQFDSRYRSIYWHYGQRIINALKYCREHDNLFPVYFSNFNCGPDSFMLTVAERIMGEKPMLILELDEHGADAGYVTRIEAFLDVIKGNDGPNLNQGAIERPIDKNVLKKKTIWIPPLHPISIYLFTTVFRSHGYKVEPIPDENQNDFIMGRSLCRGTECFPAIVTIGSFVNALKRINARPEEHILFMTTADGPCMFGQYRGLHRDILNRIGYGKVDIFSPSTKNAYQGLHQTVRAQLWESILIGDILQKIVCKIRPYELNKGETNNILNDSISILCDCYKNKKSRKKALYGIIERFKKIHISNEKKPLVGIVGDVFVRCNTYANEHVVEEVERLGGEAWPSPLAEWLIYCAFIQDWGSRNIFNNRLSQLLSILQNEYLLMIERKWNAVAGEILHDRQEPSMREIIDEGARYIPANFEGESIVTIGRAIKFHEAGARVIINCAPFGCAHGNITTAMFQMIQKEINIPVVSMFYNGEGEQTKRLETMLKNYLY
jgi:predicted CoA-substrate-specific enzyme activase